MRYFGLFISIFLLFSAPIYAENCEEYLTKFDCEKILACQPTSGVCQCANGNQCVWNLEGAQTANCPCYDLDKGYNPDDEDYCVTQLIENNCGYETACNANGSVGSCKCSDGKSSCIWSGDVSLGCPCEGSYVSLMSYRGLKFNECKKHLEGNNCDPNGIMNCVRGGGSCTCPDGTWCHWGEDYSKGCPCVNKEEKTEDNNNDNKKSDSRTQQVEL